MIVLAVVAIIIAAIQCFAGYKAVKEVPYVALLFSGASLGVSVGVLSENILIGAIMAFLIAVLSVLLAVAWKTAGIEIASFCLVTTSLLLLSGSFLVGAVVGSLWAIFTLFFYKVGLIVSSSLFGSSVIMYSVYFVIGDGVFLGDIMIVCIIIGCITSVAGILCQFLTTVYDNYDQRNIFETVSNHINSGSVSEMRYPGLQRAYRNYCIKCRSTDISPSGKCHNCGFDFEN